MQYYTIFFITGNALHVSGAFSAHHQELKSCTHSIVYMPSLLVASASVGEFQLGSNSPTLAVAASKLGVYPMLCVVFKLLMMGGKPAWNMYSIDNNIV